MRFFKALVALLIVFVAVLTAKSSAEISMPVPTAFSTENETAIAALHAVVSITTTKEMGGAIFLWHGQYYYTKPLGNNSETHFSILFGMPADATLVATYHTHPVDTKMNRELHGGHDYSEWFSPTDIKYANEHHVDSFIAVLKNGDIEKYVSGSKLETFIASGPSDSYAFETLSRGVVVGKVDQ